MDAIGYGLIVAVLVSFTLGAVTGYVLKSRTTRVEDTTPEKRARLILHHLYGYPNISKEEVRATLLKAGLGEELMTKARQMTPDEVIAFFEKTADVVDGYMVRTLFRTKSREQVHEELWHWYNHGALSLEAGWRMKRDPDSVRVLYAQTAD